MKFPKDFLKNPLETTKDGSIGDGDAHFVVCPAADIYQGIDIIYMLKSPGICRFQICEISKRLSKGPIRDNERRQCQ